MTTDRKIIYKYRLLDRDLADLGWRVRSRGPREKELWPLTQSQLAAFEAEITALEQRLDGFTETDPVLALLQHHFRQVIDSLRHLLEQSFTRPGLHIQEMLEYTVDFLTSVDQRPDQVRAETVAARLQQLPMLWESIAPRLEDTSTLYLNELYEQCLMRRRAMDAEWDDILQVRFAKLRPDYRAALEGEMRELCRLLDQWMAQVAAILTARGEEKQPSTDDDDYTVALDKDYYRRLLLREFDIDLDDMLTWYEDAVEQTRQEMLDIAAALPIDGPKPRTPGDVMAILDKYAGPCETPEQMMETAKLYIKRARAVCQQVIPMPPEYCRVVSTPESCKGTMPWGGYESMSPFSETMEANYFVNMDNYLAISDGWLKMMALHEAYPGHHVQFVRGYSDPLPRTLRMELSRGHTMLEGTCVRSERAFEFVFAEDPFFPLFVAYRRHHTSVRIKVDLTLRILGKPISEAVRIFMDELGFDKHTARMQVRQMEERQGYFTCYYYGMRKLEQWHRESGLDNLSYTRLLFSLGHCSLSTFHRFLQLCDADKTALLHDFSPLE